MQVNVIEYFEFGALRRCPDKVAVITDKHSYTFRQVSTYAKNLAARLLLQHTTFNQPIAVFTQKGIETIVSDIAVLYTGNCYANLDIKSPATRLTAIWENLKQPFVLTTYDLVPTLESLGIPSAKIIPIEDSISDAVQYDVSELSEKWMRIIDTDPVCIIHTSGSTGVPKGVALHHKGTIDFMDWAFDRLNLDGSEIIGSLSPFYFDIYTLEIFLCLAKGATLVTIPEQLAAFPARLVDFLSEQRVSFIFWVPTVMVNIANMKLLEVNRLPELKKVFFAGEVFPTKHMNYWRRQLEGAMFVNLYGPIEIHVDCTYYVIDRDFDDEEKVPIGRPCRNTDILILDENNSPAAPGKHGELCIRGSSVGLGYWNNPERTALAFVQNPLNKSYPELIYRTGDIVYINDRGEIMFVGRKDFQIKHLGYRIELGEIEHSVLRVDGIKNCCVVYDQAKKRIVLYYESDKPISAADMREQLLRYIPKYMLPTVFNHMALLPRNPNGKIDRQALASLT